MLRLGFGICVQRLLPGCASPRLGLPALPLSGPLSVGYSSFVLTMSSLGFPDGRGMRPHRCGMLPALPLLGQPLLML